MHTFWEPFLIPLRILIFCKYNFVASMTLMQLYSYNYKSDTELCMY